MPINVLILEDDPLNRMAFRRVLLQDPDFRIASHPEGARVMPALDAEDIDIAIVNRSLLRAEEREKVDELKLRGNTQFICVGPKHNRPCPAVACVEPPITEQNLAKAVQFAKAAVLGVKMRCLGQLLSAYAVSRAEENVTLLRPQESSDELISFPVETIEWIEARGNYVVLHTSSGAQTVRMTMQRAEELLRSHNVARIHRKWLVNLSHVEGLNPDISGAEWVRLRSGKQLRVSRQFRHAIYQRLRSLESGFLRAV